MDTRKTRAKRIKLKEEEYVAEYEVASVSSNNEAEDEDELRKSRIRDSNKEFARRMTILNSWSQFWMDYSVREGDAYPQQEAREIIKRAKRITCPITSCNKSFTSIGGLKYHYARCNLERSFKCKVCEPPTQLATRGELLRHMVLNHYNDLPALNQDQKEIVNTIFSCDRGDKKERKVGSDAEALCNGPRLMKSYKELVKRVFESESFYNRPFKNWLTFNKDWEVVTNEIERRQYYPPELESVHFKLSSKQEWQVVKSGESTTFTSDEQGSSVSNLFFTGGVNTASAWLPKCTQDPHSIDIPEIVAVSVNCRSMDRNPTYKESQNSEGCIQFWSISGFARRDKENHLLKSELKISLSYMIGHDYGTIFDMSWCPLGASWQPHTGETEELLARVGLLAVACGDSRIRIFSVPYTDTLIAKTNPRVAVNTIEATPVFKVKPIAILMAPGVGLSTDYHASACKSLSWNHDDNQRLIVAGYANGNVALFDLSNNSPILYSNVENHHIYHPLKSWVAHGAPVTGVAISSLSTDRTSVATGSIDRQLKLWNPMDLNSCLATDRAPITRVLWDFRFRGVVTATDTAFTSFSNRVSYRYPVVDGNHNVTVSLHRSTVWGLANSNVTSALATSDAAGEVFVLPQLINRPFHKRDRNLLCTHSLYSMIPYALDEKERDSVIRYGSSTPDHLLGGDSLDQENESNDQTIEDSLATVQATEGDFSHVERPIVNKPTKFLLPLDHAAVETYKDFKKNFGLEFIHYEHTTAQKADSKLPESCVRAGDAKNIYCDRPCDYPFSSVNMVTWSPNVSTFPYLLSCTQVGLCRIDRVQIVEQLFGGFIDSILVD